MIDGITFQQLRDMAAYMKSCGMLPSVVRSREEAEWLTANDPVGHKWAVGDEYYAFEIK